MVEFYNGLFFQYLNTIIDKTDSTPLVIFSDSHFENITNFLANREKNEHYWETKIEKQGKIFMVRINVFENGSFEIILNDITKTEKNRLLKQEMTGNIAHELRTPITGIRGCLETVLENRLDSEKERYLIQQAYEKSLALSELIQDMSLLTKIEDAPHSFQAKQINITALLKELQADFVVALQEKKMTMSWNLPDNLLINGNRTLLYAIFRNLTDNAIRYAGHHVHIQIDKYKEDNEFYYFSYSDNGAGIADEQLLNRLFERFYRISEGRTRDSGGSGLGLSIVKNAVLFHKGTIAVKNKSGGGLEFLFTLRK
jgi:signal transduction histidine kinase